MRSLNIFLLVVSLFFVNYGFAGPGVSYQGRIFKPDGGALEGTSVQFRIQVRSPGVENCLLFEELQTINMTGSSGVFSITLNDGTGTRLDASTYPVDRIFSNRDTMTLDSTRCVSGTTYTPNSTDGRKLVVYFKDETMAAYEAMPIMSLNYVPQSLFALEAQKVGTFAVNNILRTVDGSGNPVVAPALDPTQLSNLNNLIAGTSSQYATTSQFNTVQAFAKSAPPTCGASEVLKSNGTTLTCVTPAASSPSYSAITGASAINTIDNSNYAQIWNWSTATTQSPMSIAANALTTGSLMSLSTSSASLNSTNGLMSVANTGSSTSGILARFQSNSTVGSGLTVLNNGNVGIGTTAPVAALDIRKTITVPGALLANNSASSATFIVDPSAATSKLFAGNFVYVEPHGSNLTSAKVYGQYSSIWSNPLTGGLSEQAAGIFESESQTNQNISVFKGINVTTFRQGPSTTHIGGDFRTYQHTGLLTDLIGLNVDTQKQASGNITNIYGIKNYVDNGGTLTNMYGQHTQMTNWGSATNVYGHYIDTIGFGTNTYGIYQAGSAERNYFAGNVGIGTTSPQDKLDVNGNIKVAVNSSQPYACDVAHDGVLALTSQYTTCVCKGSIATWVRTTDGVTSCTW